MGGRKRKGDEQIREVCGRIEGGRLIFRKRAGGRGVAGGEWMGNWLGSDGKKEGWEGERGG